jgi:hypothetical protein
MDSAKIDDLLSGQSSRKLLEWLDEVFLRHADHTHVKKHLAATFRFCGRQDVVGIIFAVVHEVDHCRDRVFVVLGQVNCVRVRLLQLSQWECRLDQSCIAYSKVPITGFGEEVGLEA